MIDRANDLGMDAIEIGDVLGCYMEATERGIQNGDGGLVWGDHAAMFETIKKVAYREGIGNVLADGVKDAGAAALLDEPKCGFGRVWNSHRHLAQARNLGEVFSCQ